MKFNLLKGAAEVKLKSAAERRIYDYLGTFEVRSLKREEKSGFGSGEMELRYFSNKGEIKKGIREGFAVSVDCFNRYYICFSRRNGSMYLLKIQFDLDEIFGRDAADLMDIREEEVLGIGVGIEEAETLIDNYLEWIGERKGTGEATKEDSAEEVAEIGIRDEKLERWFDKEE